MPSSHRPSIRRRITVTILLIIAGSWVISTALLFLLMRVEGRALARALYERHEPAVAVVRQLRRVPTSRPIVVERGRETVVILTPLPFGNGAFLARMALALVIALLAGAWLSRQFAKPLRALAEGADAMREGKLDTRVSVEGDDEIARVAESLNSLAEKVSGQLGELRDDAERRRHLLADVAHELRSPTATLKAMAQAMRDGVADTPERRERALTAMADTADRMERLVTDLLTLTRLDLRELPLEPRPTDLRALAADLLDARVVAADEAGITLHPVADGAPVLAHVDPHRMAQVIDNLVGNAISHAGRGAEVFVTVEGGDPATINVRDTGRGIAPEHLPYLFDPFYRADAARTPGDSHSGLGLRIARGLVEAHGGTLALASTEGEGVTLTVRVPAGA
jgi:signal transduction histidine kinase